MRNRKKRSFIYCWDGDDFGLISEKPTEAELVSKIFSPLADTSVDTVFFVLGIGNFAEYPSDILKLWGESVDYNFNTITSYRRFAAVKHLFDSNLDPCEIIIKASRERNIDPFFAFRLNDIHDHWEIHSDLIPTFKKENPHWLNPNEWFPDFHGNNEITTALNYFVKEVRELRIRTIREIFEKYDFDGLELDFMRSQFYFHWDKGLSSAYIMTDFVREVRGLLDEAGVKRGKSIELAVRVCTTVIGSKMAGFDVEEWAKQGLIDIVIAGTGGLNIETGEYKTILNGTGVSFFPCLYGDYERIASNDEVMRGIAEVLLSNGPDGIYAFNTYPDERGRRELMKQIGSLETLRGLNKTYIVDMDYDYILTREEWRYHVHLPATLGETNQESLIIPIQVGEDLSGYTNVQIRLKIWIKNWSEQDMYKFGFNGNLLSPPVMERSEENSWLCWFTWDLQAGDVKLLNEVSVQLVKRNPHLAKYTPAVLERINIDVKF
jgi:hypothetical protein